MPGGRHFERPDDHLDRGRDRGHLDEGEAQEPDIRADARLIGVDVSGGYMNQPPLGAASKKIEPQRNTPPSRKHQKPNAESRRERQIARAQHLRQEKDRDGLEHRHGEEEHHHRAVHGENLVVDIGGEKLVSGHGELHAHEQRQHAGK